MRGRARERYRTGHRNVSTLRARPLPLSLYLSLSLSLPLPPSLSLSYDTCSDDAGSNNESELASPAFDRDPTKITTTGFLSSRPSTRVARKSARVRAAGPGRITAVGSARANAAHGEEREARRESARGDTARCSPFPATAEATHVARRSFVIRQIAFPPRERSQVRVRRARVHALTRVSFISAGSRVLAPTRRARALARIRS